MYSRRKIILRVLVGKRINVRVKGHNPLIKWHKPVGMLANKYIVYRWEYNESTTVNSSSPSLYFSISLPGIKREQIIAVRERIIRISSSKIGLCDDSMIERISHRDLIMQWQMMDSYLSVAKEKKKFAKIVSRHIPCYKSAYTSLPKVTFLCLLFPGPPRQKQSWLPRQNKLEISHHASFVIKSVKYFLKI